MKPKSETKEIIRVQITEEGKRNYDNLPQPTNKYGQPLKKGMAWYEGGFKQ